jgi:DNA helicase-2/ATP-dependent DNA helicase PcrA
VSIDLSVLNEAQRAAVLHGDGPLLLLAGAGSGKTRAITYRITHLVQERHVPPWRTLAVTFTNKAAGEMRERFAHLMGPQSADLHVSTFHSTGSAILRREAEALGLSKSFVIYDDTDQFKLIKICMRQAKVQEGDVPPRAIANRFDEAKNQGKTPDQLWAREDDEVHAAAKAVWPLYEAMMKQANAVDFGDLIVKPLEIFRKFPDIRDKYRKRFQYVMVDEFQDTNPAQFALVQELCPPGSNLCVVGDDDQAIYRWRGADVDNILSFDKHYPGCVTIKLEQNYRSDSNILNAAYEVIRKNLRRKEKRLITTAPPGMPLSLLASRDERGEALQVSTGVKQLIAEGVSPQEIAVFYRTNSQSRVLEEALRMARVPYAVIRGRSFYDRAEVKDAVSYLRVALSPRSDADLLRIINTPPRGIGETTVERLSGHAQRQKVSLYESLAAIELMTDLNSGARNRLREFKKVVDELQTAAAGKGAADAMQAVLDKSGLIEEYQAEGGEEGEAREENLRELLTAAQEFDKLAKPVPPPVAVGEEDTGPLALVPEPLAAFLEQISLVGEPDTTAEEGGKVSMMTLHAAKGLEFDCVFMTGMEEQVFPHARALKEDADEEELAEERRLCYVGITRARKRLFLSLAQSRAQFGELKFNRPSRFLSDIPKNFFRFDPLVERERDAPRPSSAPAFFKKASPPPGERVEYDEDYVPPSSSRPQRQGGPRADALGPRVMHKVFGEGEVRGRDGDGDDATVSVFFPRIGLKKIKARFLLPHHEA